MKKKLILSFIFIMLLAMGVLYASMIIVWMTDATYYPTPPSVSGGGGGDPLPNRGIVHVEWVCTMDSQFPWASTPPLDLECNGSVIATDITPYMKESSGDPMGGYDITGYYEYWHTVTSSGTHTYEAEHAENNVSVEVP